MDVVSVTSDLLPKAVHGAWRRYCSRCQARRHRLRDLAAFGIGRVMASLLFEATPFDPTALFITTIDSLAAAIVASLVPASRASRLNPARLLSAD